MRDIPRDMAGFDGAAQRSHLRRARCVSADLVVATSPTASRLPQARPGERRVWIRQRFPDGSARRWRVSALDALLQHASIVDRPTLIASVDSALYHHRLSASGLALLIDALPERLRGIQRDVDGRSMSGTEWKLRVACVSAGLRVEPRASIARVGLVDLLVDGWPIVEVDSREFHDGPTQQHTDKARDEVILARLKPGRP